MRKLITIILLLFASQKIYSQGCCSGSSGSPIAGGASQGVLSNRQVELSSNFQYINSNKFKTGDRDTTSLFDNFNSKYLYSKIAYGITKDLTLSIESGYFFNKTQIGQNKIDTNSSSGMGDLIIFPRYDVYYSSTEKRKIELTLGLGYKIPLGKHNDSTLVYTNPFTGQKYYTTMPPIVQPTNGSQDILLYAFFLRGFPAHNFRVFANALYIRKGWNSLGEKFGDYKSIGLFASKTFFKSLGITCQVKGEIINKMQHAENIDLLSLYNVDINSTGNKKILFVPQISYSYKSFNFFGSCELPLYEYMNHAQMSTKVQITMGLSYRFFIKKPSCDIPAGGNVYICPMKCDGGRTYDKPGKCPECGMDLMLKKAEK